MTMTVPSTHDLKQFLQSKGFEIYRTLGLKVLLAERVRDNLLMDGNVAVSTGEQLAVEFTTRAHQSTFPAETGEQLCDRARSCAEAALGRGYREAGVTAVAIRDPGDGELTLDTWHEVSFVRALADLEETAQEAAFALSLNKVANR